MLEIYCNKDLREKSKLKNKLLAESLLKKFKGNKKEAMKYLEKNIRKIITLHRKWRKEATLELNIKQHEMITITALLIMKYDILRMILKKD